MKKLVLLATAAAVLVSVPAIGSAANIKSVLNKSQTVTYQGVKLSEGVTTVSYTHLDVYKRQGPTFDEWKTQLERVSGGPLTEVHSV